MAYSQASGSQQSDFREAFTQQVGNKVSMWSKMVTNSLWDDVKTPPFWHWKSSLASLNDDADKRTGLGQSRFQEAMLPSSDYLNDITDGLAFSLPNQAYMDITGSKDKAPQSLSFSGASGSVSMSMQIATGDTANFDDSVNAGYGYNFNTEGPDNIKCTKPSPGFILISFIS